MKIKIKMVKKKIIKKEDWKYKAIMWICISEGIFVLGIIYLAANYGWWILLILLFLGSSDTERRILGLPEKD